MLGPWGRHLSKLFGKIRKPLGFWSQPGLSKKPSSFSHLLSGEGTFHPCSSSSLRKWEGRSRVALGPSLLFPFLLPSAPRQKASLGVLLNLSLSGTQEFLVERKKKKKKKKRDIVWSSLMAQWVKSSVLSLLWCGFNPWARNVCMLWARPKKKDVMEAAEFRGASSHVR